MSLGGQSGTTQTSSQSNSNVNMGPWLNQQGPLQGLFDSAVNLYNNNGLNAPTNANQTAGANAMAQLGGGTNAAVDAGNNTLTNYINGSMLSPTSNPYLAGMENAAAQQVTNQYQTATAPQTASQFELANRNGSGAALQAQNQNQLGLGNTLNNLANTFYGNAYNQGTNQQLQATSLAPTLNQAQYINPSALLSAGNTQQQQTLNQQLQPWQSAQLYQGLISGNYGQNGSTNTYSTQQTPYYSNPLGSAIGGITSLAGAALPFFMPFSDVRLKEDIKHVGHTHDGQNLYAYRYKGDPTPHVGLMAQEVEQYNPDAVMTHPSGFKMVDYRKALGWEAMHA